MVEALISGFPFSPCMHVRQNKSKTICKFSFGSLNVLLCAKNVLFAGVIYYGGLHNSSTAVFI